MAANTRTMLKPRMPRRLWRRVDHEVRSTRRSLRPIVNPRDPGWTSPVSGTTPVSDADTGIEDSVEQVRNDVAEDHEHGNDEEDGAGKEPILERDRDQEVRSESVIGEDVLQDDRTSHDESQADCEGRDDGEVGVPPGMALSNGPLRETLCLGGEYEVLPHDLKHRGLHEEDNPGRRNEDQGEHGQETVDGDIRHVEQGETPKGPCDKDRTDDEGDAPRSEPERLFSRFEMTVRTAVPREGHERRADQREDDSEHGLKLDPLKGEQPRVMYVSEQVRRRILEPSQREPLDDEAEGE